MKPDEAIERLQRIRQFYLDTIKDDTAVEAVDMAIKAVEKREKDRWRPFKCREATEDDDTSYDYIMECELPEDGQTVLVTIQTKGHEPVQVDTYYGGDGEECALDSGYALCEEAIAWRPLPEPYTEEEECD